MATRRPTQGNSRPCIPTFKGPKAVGSRVGHGSAASDQENQAPTGAGRGASSTQGFRPGDVIPPRKAVVNGGTHGLNAVDNRAGGPFLRPAKIPESRQPLAASAPEQKLQRSLVVKKPKAPAPVLKLPEGIFAADSLDKVDIKDFLSPQEIAQIPDPDIEEEPMESLVTEYVKDIIVHLNERETTLPLKTGYLENHKHIVPRHRRILLNWLIQVHLRYKLAPETLYIMCYILDAYVAKKPELMTTNYQLVGGTALWVASKFEEVWPPNAEDIVKLADKCFTVKDVIRMEQELLETLDFNFNRPSPITFLRRYSKIADVDTETHCMAKFLLELTVTEYQLVGVRPSKLAAAALYISMRSAEALVPKVDILATPGFNVASTSSQEGARAPEPSAGEKWTNQLAYYAGYPLQIIMPVVHELCAMVKKAQKMHNAKNFQVIVDKYSTSKFYSVSCHPFFESDLAAEWAALAVFVTPEDPKPEPKPAPMPPKPVTTSNGQPSGSVAITRPKAAVARARPVLVPKRVLDKRPPFRP